MQVQFFFLIRIYSVQITLILTTYQFFFFRFSKVAKAAAAVVILPKVLRHLQQPAEQQKHHALGPAIIFPASLFCPRGQPRCQKAVR